MKQRGVTLIELMIAVVIIGTLAAIAYPAYTHHLVESHRAQAKTNLVMMQLWAEDQMRTGTLTGGAISASECPTCSFDATRYTYSITTTVLPPHTAYEIFSNVVNGGPQDGDSCGTLSIKGNGATTPSDCW
ncbi:type IV pilin protein [Photobacterium sp. DNB22_13_2]